VPRNTRIPFFHEVAVGLQPDQQGMRVFLGTGNRYSILDTGAGVCRYDNPEACSRMGCTNVQNASTLSRLTRNITNEETHWNGQKFEHGRHTEAVAANTACGVAGGAPVVTASVATSTIDGCPGVPSYGNVRNRTAQCAQDAAANFSCQRTDANVNVLTDLPLAPSNAVMQSIGRNRFYGLWIYGGARTFDETAAAGLQTARIYDNTRTTDRTAARPTEGDLVDVTNTTCASKNNCAGAQATDLGMGWVIDYEDRTGWGQPFPDLEHKSAGGAGLLASCTLFATFFPNITANPGSCSAQALARSRIYQADFITGAPNCTSGFLTQTGYTRYQERDVVAPPPEMSTTIQISKSGKIRYSELLVESGQDQVTQADVSGVNDVLQTIYELPVSRELHACRHDGGTCVPSE
jgi:type IV pilus assembly protein PilY1